MNRKIWKIIQWEFCKCFKNKAMIFSMLGLPAIMVFLMLGICSYGAKLDKQYSIGIFCETTELENMIFPLTEESTVIRLEQEIYTDSVIRNGEITVALLVNTEGIELRYDSAMLTNTDAFYEAEELAYRFGFLINSDVVEYRQYDTVDVYESMDCATNMELLKSHLEIPFILTIFILFLFLENAISIISLDLFAGERERGTYDLLRMTPVSFKEILLGKAFYEFMVVLLVTAESAVATVIGIVLFFPDEWSLMGSYLHGHIQIILPVCLCVLQAAMITATCALSISALIPEKKKVQNVINYGPLAIPTVVYLFRYFDSTEVLYIPGINLWEVIEAAMEQQKLCTALSVSTLASVVICVLVISLTIFGMWHKEVKNDIN